MEKREKIVPFVTGLIFLIYGISAVTNGIFILKNYFIIVWFCHIGLILLGIGFLTRNKTIIDSQINILAIPLIIWTLDFIQFLFGGKSIFGISEYFFQQVAITSKIITSQHLFTLPLSIYSRRFVKKTKGNSILLSILLTIPVYIISRIIGERMNINLSYHVANMKIEYYPLVWFMVVFVMIFLTNYLLNSLKNLKFKNSHNS